MSITLTRSEWQKAVRPADRTVIAIGDVHGQAHLLEALHAALRDDIDRLGVPATVIHLGDLVDRGTRNRDCVDLARAGLAGDGIELVTLRGNHEDMLLDTLLERRVYGSGVWEWNGGALVRAELGAPGSLAELRWAFGHDRLAWLARLPRSHRVGELLFVHAGIRPGVPLARQRPEDLIWIREEFLSHEGEWPENVAVVHGHTPGPLEVGPHRIGIDTGAYATGVLTAVEFAGERMRFVSLEGTPDTEAFGGIG